MKNKQVILPTGWFCAWNAIGVTQCHQLKPESHSSLRPFR
jgi:hypothetical protein